MIGISFADEGDANSFIDCVNKRESIVPNPTTAALSVPSPKSMKKSTSGSSIEKTKDKEMLVGGLFSFSRRASSIKETSKKSGKIDKSMIGAPLAETFMY